MSNLLVRWRMQGILVRDGRAFRRAAGDEDLMAEREAGSYIQCGMVEAVKAPVHVVCDEDAKASDVLASAIEAYADIQGVEPAPYVKPFLNYPWPEESDAQEMGS